jgi:hypothetical protein
MFAPLGDKLLDCLDLAVELATLGEYRLDGPVDDARCLGSEDRPCAAAFNWPSPCGAPSRRSRPCATGLAHA